MREVGEAPAILLIGNNPTEQHPLLAWQIRTNVRLHRARVYIVNSIRSSCGGRRRRSRRSLPALKAASCSSSPAKMSAADAVLPQTSLAKRYAMRDKIKGEKELVIIFGSEVRGADVKALVDFGLAQGAKFVCLGDYANSRGAADMGLYPDMLPGYAPVAARPRVPRRVARRDSAAPGMNLLQMMDAAKDGKLKALYVVGSNPVARYSIDPFVLQNSFTVVQDMFLTETAAHRRCGAARRQRLREIRHVHQHLR